MELQMSFNPTDEPDAITATFMFADIAGFTALTEAHGDQEAAKLVGDFCDAVAAELPAFGGTQVKTVRDFEVTIKRALKAQYTLQASQSPFTIFRGAVDAQGVELLNGVLPGLRLEPVRVLQFDTHRGA